MTKSKEKECMFLRTKQLGERYKITINIHIVGKLITKIRCIDVLQQ